MDTFIQKKHHPIKIFLIIVFLNTFSLMMNVLSAWGAVLPYFVIIYMGINIGVVMYHSLEGRFYYLSLFNPVALLELPAAWLSITMAIQFSLKYFLKVSYLPAISFGTYMIYFFYTIIPILILAGIIETIMIVIGEKYNKTQE
jgi:hypothetical protein